MARKIVWFASGGNIAKCGPFRSQIEATNAMRLAPGAKRTETELFPEDVFVWPEYEDESKGSRARVDAAEKFLVPFHTGESMRTNVTLEAWTSYYMYDEGTHEAVAALLEWPTELDLPLLQPKIDIRLNGRAYRIVHVVIEEDGSQSVRCRSDLGYNRLREQKLAGLKEIGWRLVKEYD